APGTRSDFSLLAATAAQLTDKVFDPRVGAGLLRVDRLAFLRAQPPEMGDLEHGCVFSQQSPSQWNVWLIVRSRDGGRGRIQIRSGDFSAGVWMMDGWGVALLPGFSKGNSVVERGGTSEGISPCTLFSVHREVRGCGIASWGRTKNADISTWVFACILLLSTMRCFVVSGSVNYHTR
ncbi:MAG: hypothetical protein N2515_05270, partial [Deltaproteobacteria bacterium]|nr:hypothetical protein [Deltaproteobacteria bacterium]